MGFFFEKDGVPKKNSEKQTSNTQSMVYLPDIFTIKLPNVGIAIPYIEHLRMVFE